MGNTCIPVAIHVDIWQNQYNIVKLKKKISYYLKHSLIDNTEVAFRRTLTACQNTGHLRTPSEVPK